MLKVRYVPDFDELQIGSHVEEISNKTATRSKSLRGRRVSTTHRDAYADKASACVTM